MSWTACFSDELTIDKRETDDSPSPSSPASLGVSTEQRTR